LILLDFFKASAFQDSFLQDKPHFDPVAQVVRTAAAGIVTDEDHLPAAWWNRHVEPARGKRGHPCLFRPQKGQIKHECPLFSPWFDHDSVNQIIGDQASKQLDQEGDPDSA
jgi:hypothetical protein